MDKEVFFQFLPEILMNEFLIIYELDSDELNKILNSIHSCKKLPYSIE
jgi:hypothetical protein